MSKIWKDVEGYEGLYKVSNTGEVYSYRSKRNLKHSVGKGKSNYHSVSLSKNGKSKTFLVHRLVGFAFVDGYEDGYEINHKDADKSNNNDWNLEWCKHQHNMTHVSKNGLNPRSKMCCEVNDEDCIVKIYPTLTNCARTNKLDHSWVKDSCNGGSNSIKGVKYRYYDEELNVYIRTKFDSYNYNYKSSRRQKIICIETGDKFSSQMEASRAMNIPQSNISDMLNGKISNANGYTFKRQ